jgi:phosphomannomutase/phosphoglucomutase
VSTLLGTIPMNPAVFREYDIRGGADRDLGDMFVRELGRSIGSHLAEHGARRITLGRDCRLHSPRLHAALRLGLMTTPVDVIDIGVVPTPLMYFSVFHLDADGGIQITGSHNPPQDNGFKIMRGRSTIFGDEIRKLGDRIQRAGYVTGSGTYSTTDVVEPYLAHLADNIRLGPRRFRVVVDGGNGVGGPVGLRALRALGLEVEPLFCETDGRFPNHHPDPTVPANLKDLQAAVARTGAELGIAYDGDADRLGAVDAQGRILWGDQLLILFSRAILQEMPGATIVSEVKCSQALYDDVRSRGGRAIMWRVGHSLIKTKMKEENAALAGEMSGHLFFAHRYFGYDDAVYASLRLVELLTHSDRPLAALVDELPKTFATPELRVECPDAVKFEVVRRAVERFGQKHEVVDVDGARVRLDGGWGLVRASNTQPALVLRFEADSEARLAEIRAYMEDEVAEIRRELG